MPDHKPAQGIPIRGGRSLRRRCNRRHLGRSLEKRRLESAPCRAPWPLHRRNNRGSASQVGGAAWVLKQAEIGSSRVSREVVLRSRKGSAAVYTDSSATASCSPPSRISREPYS